MSENENQSNNDIKDSHNDNNIDPHSNYEELIGSRQIPLMDEIYLSSPNEKDDHKKNYDGDNKSEADDQKSTSLDSKVSEQEKNSNSKPIQINIKNSIDNDKDKAISKNIFEANINLSDNDSNNFQNYLDHFEEIKELKLESPSQSQSESSDNEITVKIELKNEINCNSKPNLIGKKTKRKWEFQAKRSRTSKKNKINDFYIENYLELVNNKNNNIPEDEDGDILNIQDNNFPEICSNRKFYINGYSPHIIGLTETLTRYHAPFGNWQTTSTKCNSLESNGY